MARMPSSRNNTVAGIHLQSVNAHYKSVHGASTPRLPAIERKPYEKKVPKNTARMPGKNPGVGGKFSAP